MIEWDTKSNAYNPVWNATGSLPHDLWGLEKMRVCVIYYPASIFCYLNILSAMPKP
jgi:hypothetical protein